MSIVISVEIGNERRVYTADDLPLSVGGESCHLALTDLSDDGPVAYLGHDRGELFIQPAEDRSSEVPVTCNGVPLTASRWLGDRDEIGVGSFRLRCEVSGGSVSLVFVQPAPPSIKPPVADVPQPQHNSSVDRAIRPADFKPRWQSPPGRSRFRIQPRSLVLMVAVSLLAAGAWFVLTARAVRVETAPAADHLELRGAWLTPKLGESYLLRPGAYTVVAELVGYRSLSAALEVNGDTPSVVNYVFEPLGALLTITSNPVEGAEITIDGEPSGTTPAHDIEIAAGEHTVEIVAPLHLPFQTTVVFEPGEPPRELTADLMPNWAPLVVATSPANATVSIDGEAVGSTPLEWLSRSFGQASNPFPGVFRRPPVKLSTLGSFGSYRWTAVSLSLRTRPVPQWPSTGFSVEPRLSSSISHPAPPTMCRSRWPAAAPSAPGSRSPRVDDRRYGPSSNCSPARFLSPPCRQARRS
jgi:hypothetical protein